MKVRRLSLIELFEAYANAVVSAGTECADAVNLRREVERRELEMLNVVSGKTEKDDQ